MISTKKLVKMIKLWQKFAVSQRKRILFPKDIEKLDRFSSSTPTTSSTKADNGCFVVYSADQQRFRIPLYYLNNEIFKELLKMAEEEFGLPSEGPIILPVDGKLLDYIIEMIQQGLAGDIQKALLMSVAITRCSLPSVDGKLLDYIIEMIQRGLAGDIQKALLMSVAITRCSLPFEEDLFVAHPHERQSSVFPTQLLE